MKRPRMKHPRDCGRFAGAAIEPEGLKLAREGLFGYLKLINLARISQRTRSCSVALQARLHAPAGIYGNGWIPLKSATAT